MWLENCEGYSERVFSWLASSKLSQSESKSMQAHIREITNLWMCIFILFVNLESFVKNKIAAQAVVDVLKSNLCKRKVIRWDEISVRFPIWSESDVLRLAELNIFFAMYLKKTLASAEPSQTIPSNDYIYQCWLKHHGVYSTTADPSSIHMASVFFST